MLRPRKDHLSLYEKVALGAKAYSPQPTLGTREGENYIRPAPPSAKIIREEVEAEVDSSELTALVVTESSKLVHGQQALISKLANTCRMLERERDFWKKRRKPLSHRGFFGKTLMRANGLRPFANSLPGNSTRIRRAYQVRKRPCAAACSNPSGRRLTRSPKAISVVEPVSDGHPRRVTWLLNAKISSFGNFD